MDRRQAMRSDTTDTSITPSLAEKSDVTAPCLDTLSLQEQPERILQRMLSVRSVVSTASSLSSSFATKQQQASSFSELQLYEKIGQGSCGVVFEHTGFSHVIKKEHDHISGQLWNDGIMHARILEALDASPVKINVRVPICHGFIGRADSSWWSENHDQFPEDSRSPGNLLITERILPLPQIVRNALIDAYFPVSRGQPSKQQAKVDRKNKDCLARVYLGKRRDPTRRPSPFFTLVNFNLHLDQMEELGLEVELFTKYLADALALLHWVALIDADDVEFVLGSTATIIHTKSPKAAVLAKLPPNSTTIGPVDFKKGAIHLWLLDFNRCHAITMDEKGVDEAVKAFFRNDPYYPRPSKHSQEDDQLWVTFRDRYLSSSEKFGHADLARMFIEKVLETQRQRGGSHSESEV
ncbi:MAG: hypothetical protein Q9163_000194 [Psora crenata]